LVFAYSIVAFQRRSVWRCICNSLGFPSLCATLFRSLLNCLPRFLELLIFHIRVETLGSCPSIVASFSDIWNILGSPPFSGVIRIILFSKSTSVHLRLNISPRLAPVSFATCRNAAICLLQPAIRSSLH